MKTKLLKRIRKRYSITYYPKQLDISGSPFKGEFMVLTDNKEWYRLSKIVQITNTISIFTLFDLKESTKSDAKLLLLDYLNKWIVEDYKHTRKRKSNQKIETIWYNKNK